MEDGVEEVCDRCGKSIQVSVRYFEQAMKDGELILCNECLGEYVDEQTEEMPKRCFKYTVGNVTKIDINEYGTEGWELVSVDNGVAYFKREYIK